MIWMQRASKRSRWYMGLPLAIAVVTGATVPPSALSADAASSVAGAGEYAKKFGVSIAEAGVRISRQPAIGALNSHLAATFPATFAGLWIENTPRYRVVAAFTDTSGVSAVIDSSTVASLVEVQTAKYPLRQLLQFQVALQESLAGNEAAVDVDVPRNGLLVEWIEPITLDINLARVGLSADHVRTQMISAIPSPTTTIHGGGSLSTCTSGFGVKKSINGTTWKGITTAGHCNNTQSWVQSGELLTFRGEAYGSAHDEQWHTLQFNSVVNEIFDGQAWHNPPCFQEITGFVSRDNQNIGDWECKYGMTTRFGCGELISKTSYCSTYAANVGLRLHNDGVDLSQPGDSGGPFFSNTNALAIMSCQNGNDAYGVGIDWVLSGLGVTLLTS